MAMVVSEGGLRGYINTSGDYVIEPRFERARSFSEGLAQVRLDGKWGYINETGDIVIAPAFDKAGEFYGGEAGVKIGEEWSVINTRGQLVFKCSPQDSVSAFVEGFAVASSSPGSPSRGMWYVDRDRKQVFGRRFSVASVFERVRP
jgi:hypothetical protein